MCSNKCLTVAMEISAIKSQKKRKKDSKWIISNLDNHNVNICDSGRFTVYETDVCMLAVPRKNNLSSTQSNLTVGKFTKQNKRKFNCHSHLKKAKLQSLEEDNEVSEFSDKVINIADGDEEDMDCTSDVILEHGTPNKEKDTTEDRSDDDSDMADGREASSKNRNSENGGNIEYYEQTNKASDEQRNSSMKNNNFDDVHNTLVDDTKNLLCPDTILRPDYESNHAGIDSKNIDFLMENSNSDVKNLKYVRHQHSMYNMQNSYVHQLYKIENKKKYVLHLPCGGKFYFHGKLKITLLYGEIEVFGYELKGFSEIKTLQLYSPKRCMQLSITSTYPSSTQDPTELESMFQNDLKLSQDDLKKLFCCFKKNDAVILVERLFDTCSLILNHYYDLDLFLEKEIIEKGEPIEKDLGCFLVKNTVFERRGFTQGKLWTNIKPKKCTVICGGKGVGKSTLVKFLINSELSHKGAALCLDFDPGQTEFTIPGCVSAVVIKKPLLGPNFTNITTPKRMAYIGMVNIALDPVKYMKAINYIVQSCKEDPELSDLPWFVNTMGFNKGIGLDIMINIIRLLKPDGVVQINSSDKSRNYEISLNPELVAKYSVLSLLPLQKDNLKYNIYILNSCSRMKGVGFQSGFRPAELREFMILSYFSSIVSLPYCSLNAVQPRWIHFSKIYIAVNGLVQPNYILKAINGNLVGLCNINGVDCGAKSVATNDSNDCFLKIAIQPEVAPCFGIGLVRGIDCRQEKLYVITPITNEELQNVNCLYLGNIDTPSSVYLKQKYVNEPIVYTDVRGTRNVRSLKQTFRYIPQFQKNEPK